MIASWISKIVSFVADAAGNDVMVNVVRIAGFRHTNFTRSNFPTYLARKVPISTLLTLTNGRIG